MTMLTEAEHYPLGQNNFCWIGGKDAGSGKYGLIIDFPDVVVLNGAGAEAVVAANSMIRRLEARGYRVDDRSESQDKAKGKILEEEGALLMTIDYSHVPDIEKEQYERRFATDLAKILQEVQQEIANRNIGGGRMTR